MSSWHGGGPDDGGCFQQVMTVDLTVKEALDQGLLSQITEHTEGCSDQRTLFNDRKLADWDGYARCPRCFLLHARDAKHNGLLLASNLKLRVAVQIKQASYFDNIIWD